MKMNLTWYAAHIAAITPIRIPDFTIPPIRLATPIIGLMPDRLAQGEASRGLNAAIRAVAVGG